jgi:hypothetical protein
MHHSPLGHAQGGLAHSSSHSAVNLAF